jgi:hypothetical protein
MDQCDHDGFHSGQGRYDMTTGRLRYVEVCDSCEGEVRELGAAEYRPLFDPTGSGGRLSPARAQA